MIIALQTLIFFRAALVRVLDTFLRPYYKNFSLTFNSNGDQSDEESEDQVFAEYHEEKGVVFFPPVYVQRYAAVSDCLMDEKWCGKLEKVMDFGYHDMSFIKYLKEVPGIKHIMGVDIEAIPLQCSSDLFGCDDYIPKRENPLKVTLFQGNAADPDYRLIGCDAVVAIEMIEHMLPHDLERFVHTVFGFIKPWVVVLTTPNGDFNVLFKSLEKNGLRRLDHFFEWSREQFNDWCSNIVVRYPQYTVCCKGIGPGPPDTLHLGCCSQMAVFVAKDYEKQRDLDLNSLAVVASKDVPNQNDFGDMSSSYECIPDSNVLFLTNEAETYSKCPSNKQSCVTIVLTTPIFSYDSMEYRDNALQCNLDTELGKNFLFEDESCTVLVPRRMKLYRVYEIEDVNNRLNCSTMQVKKFSKTTQNLMAKNKVDSLVHTREVVDEIKHLTKMLNFNKNSCAQYGGDHTWCNINWGDNAPYWNQYYRLVRDYSYPFETKSDDCRILDLISEEISRLIDSQWDEEYTTDVNKLEIPVQHLMQVVQHITDDVDKVKELLEWNGYQIVDDVVIHSRLVVDTVSAGTQEDQWPDNDTVSDWDASDLHSTSLSDGSTNVPEFYGRSLRRALDHKVRKLRTLLSLDEYITSELDRVVCRLMKLALHTSRSRQTPVPASWMQCKLYDLLALTEKAIERRKKHFLEEYTLRAIEYDKGVNENKCILALTNFEDENKRADQIMSEYRHLVQPLNEDKFNLESGFQVNLELGDENDFFEDGTHEASLVKLIPDEENESFAHKTKTKLEIVREWVDEEYGSSPYNVNKNQKDGADDSAPNSIDNNMIDNDTELSSRSSYVTYKKSGSKHKINQRSEIKITKKVSRKKLNFNILLENYFIKNGLMDNKAKNKLKGRKMLPSAAAIAAPIPDNLVELCQINATNENKFEDKSYDVNQFPSIEYNFSVSDAKDELNYENVSATENGCVISIVTHNAEEQIALTRSIGTETDTSIVDQEAIIEEVINVTKEDSLNFFKVNESEDFHSQTIFLYDINEPSTSKGIRHNGMDVQCGPDDIPDCSLLSATTSFTKLPKIFSKGIKIGQSRTNLCRKITFDAGTSPDSPVGCQESPKNNNHGIWIHDSDTILTEHNQLECSTMTPSQRMNIVSSQIIYDKLDLKTESTLLKPIPCGMKTYGSGSEVGCSMSGIKITSLPRLESPSKNTSNIQIQYCAGKNDEQNLSPTRQVKPKLSCGGIYVHSFRDREVSEDVVFQGGWNEINKKTVVTKNSRKIPAKKLGLPTKKLKRSSNTSVRNNLTKNDANNAPRRPIPIRIPKQSIARKEQLNKKAPSKKPESPINNKSIKTNKNVKKVSSKNAFRTFPKHTKSVKERQTISPKPLEKERMFNEKPSIQNYLPAYLKRKSCRPRVVNNILSKSIESAQPLYKITPITLVRSNTEEIKRNTFKENPAMYISYQVFRNEIENKNYAGNVSPVDYKDLGSNSVQRRSSSPVSQHSSCSTPNSIATIRAISSSIVPNKKYSMSSNKSGIAMSTMTAFGSTLGSKIKNIIKNNKNAKRNENKENIATAKGRKNTNCGIVGSTNTILKQQSSLENSNLRTFQLNLSKSKMISKKSISKLQNIKSSHRLALKLSSSLLLSNASTDKEIPADKAFFQSSLSDTVIILEPNKDEVLKGIDKFSQAIKFENSENNKENLNEITKCNDKTDCPKSVSADSSLEESINKLFEENFDLITSTPQSTYDYYNSDAPEIYNADTARNSSNTKSSPASFRTIIDNKNSCNFKNELEEALNNSFNREHNLVDVENSDVTINLTEYSRTAELKSFESMCSSKYSEYFLADNQFDLLQSINNEPSVESVKGLFERKDHNILTNVTGPIALQAFSGFSMNVEPLAGDQPAYNTLVDPETGSLRQEVPRQATSEEILVSGRSSDTYESCYVEEDSFVPSWLFSIISQQQSMEELEEDDEDRLPLPMPIVEPIFDVNGNITEHQGIGASAGAGDGRGMHSDHSQDSSGRGTSLSSSDTSSDTHSEAILIDPSAYVAQFEYVQETADVSNEDRPSESPDTSFTTAEADNGYDNRPRLISRTIASDIDADVSSLDTDVADSDT